jgi:large subunit ribosomal protein L1
MPAVRSKRYRAAVEGVDFTAKYQPLDAARIIKQKASAKFDESVELAINLAIDTKQSDQLVRGSLSLPHGTGKSVRVVAFCDGPDIEAAKAAGALEAGAEELVEKVKGGWIDFDVAIAHPKMMKFVGGLGKVLGPKGLMPSPKSGTVAPDVAKAVREFSAGKIEFRNDKFGGVNMIVGKVSFDAEKIAENIETAVKHIIALRPTAVKGDNYIMGVHVSSTMGIGLELAVGATTA